MIKSIHWDITHNCNLRCQHCYNAEKYFNENAEIYIGSEITLEQCLSAVEKFYKAGFKHIHFLGGEPLVSPHIFEVIDYAKKMDMIVTINSNACLLTPEIQHKLIEAEVDHFAASLDGCSEKINDTIRGKGTFKKVMENMTQFNLLKQQMKSRMQTAVVFTLTKKNINDLHNLPRLAKQIGVNLIVLTTFIESGKGKVNSNEFKVDFYDVCDKIEKMVAEEINKYSIPLQIDMRPRFCEYLSKVYNAPVIYNEKNSLCCAGEEVWYMEANGDVHPCLVFQLEAGRKALHNGRYTKEKLNINVKSLSDIQKSNYWESFLKEKHNFRTEKISTCVECRYLQNCQPCFLEYSDSNALVFDCEWTKERELKLFNKIINNEIHINNGVILDKLTSSLVKDNEKVLILGNEISVEIWELLCKKNTLKEIYEHLLKEYDVDENTLKQDIIMFLMDLRNHNAVSFVNI